MYDRAAARLMLGASSSTGRVAGPRGQLNKFGRSMQLSAIGYQLSESPVILLEGDAHQGAS
jgi:hypothetical protein